MRFRLFRGFWGSSSLGPATCLSCYCNERRNLCAYYRVAIWQYEEYPMFSGKKEKKKIYIPSHFHRILTSTGWQMDFCNSS